MGYTCRRAFIPCSKRIHMRIIIAGSRDFDNFSYLQDIVFQFAEDLGIDPDDIEIVCGEARGADLLGRKSGERYGLQIHSYPADWDKHGKSAGYRRNVQMAENADALIAFHMNKSKGTQHMINIAKEKGLIVLVKDIGPSQYPEDIEGRPILLT